MGEVPEKLGAGYGLRSEVGKKWIPQGRRGAEVVTQDVVDVSVLGRDTLWRVSSNSLLDESIFFQLFRHLAKALRMPSQQYPAYLKMDQNILRILLFVLSTGNIFCRTVLDGQPND